MLLPARFKELKWYLVGPRDTPLIALANETLIEYEKKFQYGWTTQAIGKVRLKLVNISLISLTRIFNFVTLETVHMFLE